MEGPKQPTWETVREFLEGHGCSSGEVSSLVFKDLSVEGSGRGVQAAPTVWRTLKPWANFFNPVTYSRVQPSRTLLHGFSGTLQSGEMLLVIGKPGSGCTTFLKTLADMRGEYKDTTGKLTYGGRAASDWPDGQLRLTFCAEEDEHLPTLTVAETLRFAVRSTWNAKASKDSIDRAVLSLAKCFGIGHVLNTRVGNSAIRGVSGGERRRVTLAEAMATCPDLLCLDNPTNGLDSSTALEFVQMIREYTSQHRGTTAMSVYQGSEAMFTRFDKVIVIKSGRQIFYGKASEAQEYFESIGFVRPERMTITDYLNSMTAEAELRHVKEGWQTRVPRTPTQFEEAFRQSKYYAALLADIKAQEKKIAPIGQERDLYALPLYRQVFECACRQTRVLLTNYNVWMIEAICIIIQSLVLGTLFRNQPRATKAFFMLSSSLFYSALVPALQSMAEFGNTFAQRPLVMRQKHYRFYRPMSYALGLLLTDFAWKIVAISYNIPQYFLTGFQYSADKFFTWFLIVYIEHMALSMIFRAIAVFTKSVNRAILPVGIMFNVFVLYTGLYVPIPQMQNWLFWLRYLNPLYYGFEAVIANEFGNLSYSCSPSDIVPAGDGYNSMENQVCAVPGARPGMDIVLGEDYIQAQYGFSHSRLWRNVGINAAFLVFFAVCTGIGMERHKVPAGRLATVFYKAEPKDMASERKATQSDSEKGSESEEVPPPERETTRPTTLDRGSGRSGRTLAWKNLTLELQKGSELKRLLDNVSGVVEPGQLTALMGVSGAGKTTLLNTLAGRIDADSLALSGDICLSGKPLPKSFRRHMGYVHQQDVHLPTQTVREALRIAAHLRRPATVSRAEKDRYVEDVIGMLEMEDIADALVGVPGAGLNLEQRKRVTIGAELAAKPDVLFLDEPSSGLDGQSAMRIVRLLRKLADSGQTVLCTIHQPAAELIEIFDHLLLLARGGKVVYDGPLGENCEAALQYFGHFVTQCDKMQNPAEYFLSVVGAGNEKTQNIDWPKEWQSSDAKKALDARLAAATTANESHSLNPDTSESDTSIHAERTYAMPRSRQLVTVLHRAWLFYWREPDYFVSKLLLQVFNALLNGLTYLNSPDTQKGAYNRVFSLFMSLIVGPALGLQTEARFRSLLDIFLLREKDSLTYHWLVFAISAIVVELPYAFLTSLAYWLLWYYPVGYSTTSSRAGYNFLMYELFSIFAHSLAQLCAAVMPSLPATFMANGFFFMFFNTFAGTLSPRPSTPTGWRWYYYISPLYYFSEGATVNVLDGLSIHCDEAETYTFVPPNGTSCGQYAAGFLKGATGYLLNDGATDVCRYCRYKDGQAYYTQYGYEASHQYRDIGIFIGFIALNYTGVIVFTYLTKVHRWKRN